MACPEIITGDQFVVRTIAHIDCQARELGTFGYQSLAEPGSAASLAITGLLTIFIALFGLRLLLGPGLGIRDTVYDVLKIGIVLTLAFSWPAFKTVIYDVTIETPAEVASTIAPSGMATDRRELAQRLQAVDSGLVDLVSTGTGRQNGALVEGKVLGGDFTGTALDDNDALGNARLFFLVGIIGSLALLRLAAGLLLALAPLAAGLLLFDMTRGLFSGWLRGLVLTILGTIGATIVLAVELAVIEPWLADALRVRNLGYATPAAPTEIYAMTLAFTLVLGGMVWLVGRIAFMRGWQDWRASRETVAVPEGGRTNPVAEPPLRDILTSRVERIADSVSTQIRREEARETRRLEHVRVAEGGSGSLSDTGPGQSPPSRLGSSYRRSATRSSTAASKRDNTA